MIQIILMVVGLVYLVKLPLLRRMSPDKSGMERDASNEWRRLKRRSYHWMIAAGWGSALSSAVLTFTVFLVVDMVCPQGIGDLPQRLVEFGLAGIGIAVMLACWSKSRSYSRQAKALDSSEELGDSWVRASAGVSVTVARAWVPAMVWLAIGAIVSYFSAGSIISTAHDVVSHVVGGPLPHMTPQDFTAARITVAAGGMILIAWPAVMVAAWQWLTRSVQAPRGHALSLRALLSIVVWGAGGLLCALFRWQVAFLSSIPGVAMDQYPLLSMVSAEVYWVVSFAVLASFPATIGFLWKLGALRAGRAAAGIGLCFLVSSGVIVLPMWGHDILSIIFNYLVALVPNVTCLGVLVFLGIGAGALSRRFSSSAPEY